MVRMMEKMTHAQTFPENGLSRLKYGVSGSGMAVATLISKVYGG